MPIAGPVVLYVGHLTVTILILKQYSLALARRQLTVWMGR